MEQLEIRQHTTTLVDMVENCLLAYFREHDLRVGDPVPNEQELSAALGVARSVLREALSRLKMMGMIETRTRKGMILTEPSLLGGLKRVIDPRILGEAALFDLLGFRIALEIGICGDIFRNMTAGDIADLEEIVRIGQVFENNEYAPVSEFAFHARLYKITGNRTIQEFQEIIRPVMVFVRDKFSGSLMPVNVSLGQKGELVSHADLLGYIKRNDEAGYREALERHFAVYRIFMNSRNAGKEC